MPRKTKKPKVAPKKKAAPKPKMVAARPMPRTGCCDQIGYGSGLAYQNPTGFADRLGMVRQVAAQPPVTNVYYTLGEAPTVRPKQSAELRSIATQSSQEPDYIPLEEAIPESAKVSFAPEMKIPKPKIIVRGPGPVIKKPVMEAPEPIVERKKRTNIEIYYDLLIDEGFPPNNAMALATSIPKEDLRQRINIKRAEIARQKAFAGRREEELLSGKKV